ncbi:PP2C family protein-serine/threonine phosphatase [Streptomyces marincola]|uniref:PP2C family protein-serine/threonine phosphatase n=1 Tax=Streptomyces marincola TaxID=2878388 RepID=UPI001CF2030D|nr:PP2C family protein-serine/threonine phosphatase [Streptomyces marincola]UCM91480.1 serine/threonine-protein phosphatase [Streptomyces marincola]
MTISQNAALQGQASPPSLGPAWLDAPCPVLVADRSGVVRGLNARAAALFPRARSGAGLEGAVPGWLTDAHPRDGGGGAQAVRGTHGGRTLSAHPTPGQDGDVVWWLLDDTERAGAEAALREERRRTAFLSNASTALLASLNVDRCLEVAARMAASHLADAAVVVAAPTGRRGHAVTHGLPSGEVTSTVVDLSPADVPGLDEALRGFPPVPSRWIDPSALPAWAVPDGLPGPVGSVVVTPLPGHGVPAGALILLRRTDHAAFDEGEEILARLFAARAGAAVSAARLYAEQAGITATLMRELLPPRLRRVNGVEFAGGYRPSRVTERVGGDFYDVHPGAGDEQESLAVLGDVCGKGLDAAVLTGKIRSTLHALLPLAADHGQVLKLLNGALLTSHHARFATLVLASVARAGSRVRLRLTSAGHPAPLIVRDAGPVEAAETGGTLVGALPEVGATTATVELAPGETCLLYTDGISEARGGPLGNTEFGEERLRAALAGCAGMPAEAVVERVQMLASEWVGDGRHDDMALLAITAPGAPASAAISGRAPGRRTA